MNQARPGVALSRLDALICAYLALPLLFFCAWFKWPVAIVLAAILVFGFHRGLRGAWQSTLEVRWLELAAISVVALAWTALSGVGHFAYANLDWVTRDAVLRDLTVTAWPPQYENNTGVPLILRAPVAYYLPAAAVGSLLSLQVADLLLYLWTALGFGLTLCGVAALFPSSRQRLIACALMLGFGGLDWIGTLLYHGRWPQWGEHIEWWALFAQYSSPSTLMFWVPNHALPAWLGLVLVLRHWRQPTLARITPLLTTAIPLWSPLSALGLAPFFMIGLNWQRDARQLFSLRDSLPLFAATLLFGRYLTMDAQTVVHHWTIQWFSSAEAFWLSYATFCFLEFGLLVLVLVPLRAVDLKLILAVVILLLLPFYRLGPGSDLVTRCSIPALTILALATVRPLAEGSLSLWRLALFAILAVGALGAAQEPERALLTPRWALTGQSLGEVSEDGQHSAANALPVHYVAQLKRPELALLMRAATTVRPSAAAASAASR